jgi:hypothetical protein
MQMRQVVRDVVAEKRQPFHINAGGHSTLWACIPYKAIFQNLEVLEFKVCHSTA